MTTTLQEKQGYKKTELGWIPEDWEVVKLQNLYDFQYGKFNNNPDNGGEYPVYGANGIIGGYTEYNAEYSTIIGHMGAYAGSVLWESGKHFVTYNGTIAKPKDKNIFSDRFGYFILLSLNILKTCSGSGQPFLSYDTLNQIKVSVPSFIKEQQKIAEILSTLDAKIEKNEKQIEQMEQLKKALMQELLTNGIGHTEFKDTEIGKVPASWQVLPFIELMILQRGYDLPVQNRLVGLYPLVASNGVIDYHCDFKVKGPGVVTGRSGTLGKIHFVEKNYWPLNTTLYVKETYDNYPKFLYYFLQNFRIEKHGTGTGVPTLNRNIVHDILIAKPLIPEQQKIAEILSSADEKIEILQNKKSEYERLKKGLMQKLLTGQIRVRV